jgi:hypothetical protein
MTSTVTTLLVVCLGLGWCLRVRVCCVPFSLKRGLSLYLEVYHHREMVVGMLGSSAVSLLDVTSLVANTSIEGMIVALGLKRAMGRGLQLVVHVVLQGDVWVFYLGVI